MGFKGGFLSKLDQKKGQVTIFIIIAILIVAGVALFFVFRGSLTGTQIPATFQPAYTTFLSCLQQDTGVGISTLESQGGYITLPAFEPGSQHMPFSSQLNFLGNPIPYWFYVSGNNIPKEQVPTKQEMEDQLARYIEDKIRNCDFSSYYGEGFQIQLTDPIAGVSIDDNLVEVDLNANLNLVKDDESILVREHSIEVNSRLGSLYSSALNVYEESQETLFLEEYAIDTLRNYAPVDGIEITCSPLVWNADDIYDDLQEGIEANTVALTSEQGIDDYFELDISGVDHEVRFLNSRNWPYGFEINPANDGPILVANPIGNQAGLGVLGFCYVPYHFVYDVRYPVLVQVYEGEEIFQFPVAVIIEDNNPRESLATTSVENLVPELCTYKNTPVNVNVRDTQGAAVQADISYECFSNSCLIGQTTSSGSLTEDFPQCVNGYVHARAEGFEDARYLLSTVSPGNINIILDRIYTKDVQLKVDNVNYNGDAIITFTSGDSVRTVAYPSQRIVELSEGQYEIQVYVYENSSIEIGATVTEQCVDIPAGVFGIFGITKESCFEIEVPEQVISQALSGGGTQEHFVLESVLIDSNTIEINAESLSTPTTIQQLQVNYLLFEENGLEIEFV